MKLRMAFNGMDHQMVKAIIILIQNKIKNIINFNGPSNAKKSCLP